MVDALVVLTPLLIIGVVLLLGFAGCKFDPSAVAAPSLSFRVRVPMTLTVTEMVFRAVNPDGVVDTFTASAPMPGSTEGSDNLFFHSDGPPVAGGWMVACRVTVTENGATAQDAAQQDVSIDGTDEHPRANFQASGTPSGGDFTVAFTGVD